MPDVKEILDLMHNPSSEDRALVEKAYLFAENAHKDYKRFSGEPYFNHLFETAKSLAGLGLGPKTISAGLLHDSVEDAHVSEEEVTKEFGEEILFLIKGVTKLGKLKYRGLDRHTESLRRLFVATSQDVRVLLIKLTDRLHNMRTLDHVRPDKQRRIAEETLEIYAPIAHRLGIGVLRRELEDLAFKYVHPKEYVGIAKIVKQKTAETQKHLEKMIKAVKKVLGRNGIRDFTTTSRLKGLYSLYLKLKRKDGDIEKVYDISALRIVVPTVEDCYKVLGIIHTVWRPLPRRIKDYIAFPKPNGYRSIHTTVFTGDGGILEIQIRTREMHQEAEFGIASHVFYKGGAEEVHGRRQLGLEWLRNLLPFMPGKGKTSEKESQRKERAKYSVAGLPGWIREMSDMEEAGYGKEFLARIKADFFSYRVFAFTPKGDVVDLPIDSSPVDFAYAIHSDIGDHIAGAKVNGKMVALDTKLHNGDIVEIMTKPSAKPSSKWLDVAKTTLAQKQIRAALAKEKTAK